LVKPNQQIEAKMADDGWGEAQPAEYMEAQAVPAAPK